jgi:hypothetical protein
MYTSEFENIKIVLDTVLERDMDLLVIEEMLHSNDFAKRIFATVEVSEDCKIMSIQRSLRFEMGETDIFLVLQTPEGDIIDLHIEDKVNAEAQPEQFFRYEDRAKKLCDNYNHSDYKICIIAPQCYLRTNSEAQKYPYSFSYEEIFEYFQNQNDIRSKYKLALINCALGKKDTVIAVINEEVTNFWDELDRLAVAKGLQMISGQSQHGKESKFIRFKTRFKGIYVVYKARHGNIDLQIPNPEGNIVLPKELLSEHMSVCNFKKDIAVRVSNSNYILNLEEDINDHKFIVDEILNKVLEMISLCDDIVAVYPNIFC